MKQILQFSNTYVSLAVDLCVCERERENRGETILKRINEINVK